MDQRCPQGKQLLELLFKKYREQTIEKFQPKATTLRLTVTQVMGAKNSPQSFGAIQKTRKEKKKKWQQKECKKKRLILTQKILRL